MKRKEIFRQNLRFIHSLNRANKGFTLAVNRFADISDEEMFAFKGRRYTTNNNGGLPFPYTNVLMKENLPETFDWRIEGAVTPVKGE